MQILHQILELLKYILPALVVLVAVYIIANKFLTRDIERRQLEIYQQKNNTNINLRLQAYERLTIFCERMHPTSMISRYYTTQATAQDVQLAMVQGIRAEWDHNVSQQLYVSNDTWQTVKNVMEQEITALNTIGSTLPIGAPAQDFVKKLSEYIINSSSPTSIALTQLNKEAKALLSGNIA